MEIRPHKYFPELILGEQSIRLLMVENLYRLRLDCLVHAVVTKLPE
jgi:hypothetical protein